VNKHPSTIVRRLLVTEKGTLLKEKENQVLFQVDRGANKLEVKQAVEQLFKVKVTGVNLMNRKGKKKRERSPNYGRTSDWKRAVVTLADGHTIDLT